MGAGGCKKSRTEHIEELLSKNAVVILGGILLIAVVVSLVVGGVYYVHFRNAPISSGAGAWGELGDYFGGTLNPIFGFLSVMALLVALVLQNRELKFSRDELEKSSTALNAQNRAIEHQRFEQTFFAWLNNYRELLREIERASDRDGVRSGRRALQGWWAWRLEDSVFAASLGEGSASEADRPPLDAGKLGNATSTMLLHLPPDTKRVAVGNAIEKWNEIYRDNLYQLDNLFRVLYRLIRWIDSQDPKLLSQAQKWFYVSIVRAQLSWIELVYLFYNGHTERGTKFRALINKYALFDNLGTETNALLTLMKEAPPDGTGYALTAYSSAEARKALGLPEDTEGFLTLASQGSKVTMYPERN